MYHVDTWYLPALESARTMFLWWVWKYWQCSRDNNTGFRKATETGRWQVRDQDSVRDQGPAPGMSPLYAHVCVSTTGHHCTSSSDAVRSPFDFFNHIKQSGVSFWNRTFQTLCSVWRWLPSGFPVSSCSQLVILLALGRKGKQVVLYWGLVFLQLGLWELVNAWV